MNSETLAQVLKNVVGLAGEARFPNRTLAEQQAIAQEFAMLEQVAGQLESGATALTTPEEVPDGDSE